MSAQTEPSFDYWESFKRIKRESEMEREVRAMDAPDIATRLIKHEDKEEELQEIADERSRVIDVLSEALEEAISQTSNQTLVESWVDVLVNEAGKSPREVCPECQGYQGDHIAPTCGRHMGS